MASHHTPFNFKARTHDYLQLSWKWFKKKWQDYEVTRWLILLFLVVFLIVSVYFTIQAKTANVSDLNNDLKTQTVIYDAQGKAVGGLHTGKGTYVPLSNISRHVQNAVISTEDRSFYRNWGFSFSGTARAILSYMIHRGQIETGGSTITQQLAKNMLLTQKQTARRKLAEIFLAVEITQQYTKKQILTMYLNNAYFGDGIWGVQDAAKRYFNTDAKNLTVAQGATLAAMLRNPTFYNPADYPKNAKSRRNLVLSLEVQAGHLTAAQAKVAQAEPLNVENGYRAKNDYQYPSYFDAVIDEAISKYHISEKDLVTKGYKIYTALNPTYQKSMQTVYTNSLNFPANATDGTMPQSGSIALNPKTGGVMAVVGRRGANPFRSYNYATMIKRQPGSTIKPLAVYLPALQNGYQYDSILPDRAMSFGSNHYTPTNADGQYLGEVPLYLALAQSRNIPAVWLLDKIGVQKGVNSVNNFGISVHNSDQNLALALGGLKTGVSPLQMAQAYTAFANNGVWSSAHFITKIVDASGAIVGQAKITHRTIMTKKQAKTMTSMMLGVFDYGTGTTAKPFGFQLAGKTGSTEVPRSYGYGTKDQWIVGYTPDIVTATWVGFDQTNAQHFLAGTSVSGVAKIFKAEMTAILPETPQTSFHIKNAQTLAQAKHRQSTTTTKEWWRDLGDNVQKAVDNAKNTVGQWYNQIEGLFKH